MKINNDNNNDIDNHNNNNKTTQFPNWSQRKWQKNN